jgi:hypothetical protein
MISIDKRPEILKITIQILEALSNNDEELAINIFYALNLEHQIVVTFELNMGALQELKNHPLLRF